MNNMMNDRLTEKQQKLITKNYGLLISYISKNISTVPEYLREEFISDTFLRFCISALKYNEETGFRFSTYAHGGFNFSLHEIFGRKNQRARKMHSLDATALTQKQLEYKEVTHVEVSLLDDFIDKVELDLIEKDLVKDYYYNKISYQKLSDKHGISKQWTRMLIKRSLRKMRLSAKIRNLDMKDFYT